MGKKNQSLRTKQSWLLLLLLLLLRLWLLLHQVPTTKNRHFHCSMPKHRSVRVSPQLRLNQLLAKKQGAEPAFQVTQSQLEHLLDYNRSQCSECSGVQDEVCSMFPQAAPTKHRLVPEEELRVRKLSYESQKVLPDRDFIARPRSHCANLKRDLKTSISIFQPSYNHTKRSVSQLVNTFKRLLKSFRDRDNPRGVSATWKICLR